MSNSLPFRFVGRWLRELVKVNASLDAVGSVCTVGLGIAVITDCFFCHDVLFLYSLCRIEQDVVHLIGEAVAFRTFFKGVIQTIARAS